MLCDVRVDWSNRLPLIRAASLVCAIAISSPYQAAADQAPKGTDALRGFSQSVESLVQRTAPSVVQIVVSGYGPLKDPERTTPTSCSAGSGAWDRASSSIPTGTS